MPVDAKIYDSYVDWANDYRWKRDMTEAERRRGEDLLLEAIASGAVSELDGRDSPVTRRILARHGAGLQFQMNSNWVASPQDWRCPAFIRSRRTPTGNVVPRW